MVSQRSLCYDKKERLAGKWEGIFTETEKKKTWSLNRMVVLIMMAGYAALLILLSCMDYYLGGGLQNRGRERRAVLAEAAEGVEKAARICGNPL